MKYTKDKNGNIFGYDDQDSLYAKRISEGHTVYEISTEDALESAKSDQKIAIKIAYQIAINRNISFTTAAGVTAYFQDDNASVTALKNAIAVYVSGTSALPSGYYWQAADNSQLAFTAADLSGLMEAIVARDWECFQKLQTLKAEIAAATTIEAVKLIVWSE